MTHSFGRRYTRKKAPLHFDEGGRRYTEKRPGGYRFSPTCPICKTKATPLGKTGMSVCDCGALAVKV